MAFHFFAHPTSPGPDAEGLSRFYSLCISVIQSAATMHTQQKIHLPSVSQSFIDRTITLAGFTILRLVRSPLAQHLDVHAGERAFSQACDFLKNVSMQPGDIHIRTALIMKDLWGSDKVFRKRDGRVESLYLRLRTRLSMSVSYDMFWYWREEFGNMQNPYSGDEATLLSNENGQHNVPRKYLTIDVDRPMANQYAKNTHHNNSNSSSSSSINNINNNNSNWIPR
jgi:hypothetical protein